MSAFRSQPGLTSPLGTPPSTPSTSGGATSLGKGPALVPDAAAPQIAARPPPLPKVEKARPKIRASKAALTITPKAVARLQGLLKGPTPQLIRIGVRNKGCAGLSYHLEYVDQPGKFDEVVEQDGVRVLIDSKALFSIIGSEMDWTEDALSAVRNGEQPSAPTDTDDVQAFAAAVANAPTTRLTPPMMPDSTMASMSLSHPSAVASSPFDAVRPADLAVYIDDPATLVIDIRPHAAYADARLPRALSLSVPSTLLKRPLFSLDRLAAMLPSPAARHRFTLFRESSRILVYDADANSIPQSSNIHGLLRKFRAAHFDGELLWLRGGFSSVWREQRHLVDTGPQSEPHDDDDDADDLSGSAPPAGTSVLRTHHLPMSAFGLRSTTLSSASPLRPVASNPFFDAVRQNTELSHGITERIPLRLPHRVRRRINDLPFPWLRDIARRADRMPTAHHQHHHRVHMSMHMSNPNSPYTTRTPYHLSSPSSASPSASASASASSSFSDSSDSDAAPSAADVDEGSEALAMQFYRIELVEQRRLMGVMEHHSKESSGQHHLAPDILPGTNFPFSITAGVEKGAKNRYRHIWPFEHARVRLYEAGKEEGRGRSQGTDKEVDDYVNASYVQPLGTTRRYIATQGPLDATFEDFWRLTWQQNVHVIVMLTQEMEGAMIKCGSYWPDAEVPERTFGALRVTLVKKVGLPGDVDLMNAHTPAAPSMATHESGFSFGRFELGSSSKPWKGKGKKGRRTMIKRTFKVEHAGYLGACAREVVQLQFLEWPDMNVPEDARGVLELVKEVEKAVQETGERCESPIDRVKLETGRREGEVDGMSGVAWHVTDGRRPVLLHCSAGVGRTGGFIAIDAVLDAVRREFRAQREKERKGRLQQVEKDEMDVDADVDEEAKDGEVVTFPLPVSGDPSSGSTGSDTGSPELVVHVPAVMIPSSLPSDYDPQDTPMSVDIEDAQTTRQWAENVDNPYMSPQPSDSGHSVATPPPPSSPSLAATFPKIQSDDGASISSLSKDHVHPHPVVALKVNSLPRSSAASMSSASTSGSMPPLFSDFEGGAIRMRGGSKTRDSSLETSISGGSTDSDVDVKPVVGDEDKTLKPRFRTISESQHSRALARARGKSQLPLGPGLSAGSSPLAQSSQAKVVSPVPAAASQVYPFPLKSNNSFHSPMSNRHPSTRSSPPLRLDLPPFDAAPAQAPAPPAMSRQPSTVDYKEPRPLHGMPKTPVELNALEEPIWEVVQDMREQRMSLCQTLRQYVFVHQVIIEGALAIVDEELEREKKDGLFVGLGEDEQKKHELDGLQFTASPLPTHGTMFSFGSGGAALNRSNTLPPSFSSDLQHHLPSTFHPAIDISQTPQTQKFTRISSVNGVSSDSGSMKRGASPTELLKEGKKGRLLLSKRPSIKMAQKPSKDAEGTQPVMLGSVPPSPRTLQ
ncbi:hypothetical protein H0H87_011444 [Tephrocybe sp. NHM501043]|nr:hypothetical protein H0H87_011444 [Tephrocybe sp. NHM501043]